MYIKPNLFCQSWVGDCINLSSIVLSLKIPDKTTNMHTHTHTPTQTNKHTQTLKPKDVRSHGLISQILEKVKV